MLVALRSIAISILWHTNDKDTVRGLVYVYDWAELIVGGSTSAHQYYITPSRSNDSYLQNPGQYLIESTVYKTQIIIHVFVQKNIDRNCCLCITFYCIYMYSDCKY